MCRSRFVGSVWCLTALALGSIIGCTPETGGGDGGGGSDGGANTNDQGTGGDTGNGSADQAGGIVADHLAAAAFESIPAAFIDAAATNYRIFYGHTSHGSQIITGMQMIMAEDNRFAFNSGPGSLTIQENAEADLGQVGDLPDQLWVDITCDVLDSSGGDLNVVMWSWCGGVSENTEEGIGAYLEAMNQLEADYPDVVFVYMTGHLDGTGASGNLHARNDQIRDYCRAHGKILFDFADIESYDPGANFYPDGSDACEWCDVWCSSHSCPSCDECAHSACFNCYQKGRAFWWMMARIAGWSGSPTDDTLPDGGDTPPTDGGDVTARLRPADLSYQGAFRLPADFNWGALGLSYYPGGAGGAGSLLATGFELLSDPSHPGESCWDPAWTCSAFFGELAIPTPVIAANWEDLPEATFLTPMTAFDNGLASTVHREYLFVSGIEYVPRRGSQTSDKIYGSINLWYAEGAVGEDTFPTIWFSNLDGTGAQGMFHVGPEESPYHGRKMGAYLFSVPAWYADQYLGGRTLVTGRSRGTPLNSFEEVTTSGGSQGPTLFAFRALDSDTASGDLDALPMLYYRVSFPGCAGPNVGDPAECDYPDFTMCDDWSGGVFADNGTRRAIMLLGYKGLGSNCYDEPPVECGDPCSQSHGYHCQPYERQVIFYDVQQLARTALGQQDPWVVLPYAIWRPTEFYLGAAPCWNMGGMAFDELNRRLYVVERGLGTDETNATVVHVWSF